MSFDRSFFREIADRVNSDPKNICGACGKVITPAVCAVGVLRHKRAGRYEAEGFECVERCMCEKND